MLTTAAVCAAVLAAGWRWERPGVLTNTPAGQAYCIHCGQFVPQARYDHRTSACVTCRNQRARPAARPRGRWSAPIGRMED